MTTSRTPALHDLRSLYSQPVVPASPNARLVTTQTCEVCGACQSQPVYLLPGTPYQIIHCLECGLESLFPPPMDTDIADFYPARYYGSGGRKFSRLIELLVRMIAARNARFLTRLMARGGRILDVGCGRGVTLRVLADAGHEVHGFEVNAAAVEGLDSRIHARVAKSLAAAQFDGEFFDGIIVWHVLEHVSEPEKTLREVHRILRPQGILVVAVPNLSSWQARWAGSAWFHLDPPRHLFHYPLPALKQLLEKTGFHCERVYHFSLRQNPFGWIQSAINCLPWLPRNGLYAMLHRRRDTVEATSPLTLWTRIQLLTLMILLLPFSLLLSVAAAMCRRGATVHLVAIRKPDALTPGAGTEGAILPDGPD